MIDEHADMSRPEMAPSGIAYGSGYDSSYESCASGYLLPAVMDILGNLPPGSSIFDLGCGAGSDAASLANSGYRLVSIDPSASGIAIAKERYPDMVFEVGSTEDDLVGRFGKFDVVVSLEVVEHVYSPERFALVVRSLLNPGGMAIISTPYHGYWKNLALALTGKMDDHFTALWEGGHIKFWSRDTLDQLFASVGMKPFAFKRVGRLPAFAKSMVVGYRADIGATGHDV